MAMCVRVVRSACAHAVAINVTVEMISNAAFGCTYCYGNCIKLAQRVQRACAQNYVGVI